jgi:hypothetical protein
MSADRKELGRIQGFRWGMGGYQDAMFGATFTLGGSGWGVNDFWGAWAPGVVDPGEFTKWTEAERCGQLADATARLCRLMKEAGVNDSAKLVGTPIEITFDGNTLKSWRVLTEVLA